jgi:hypothetical protein
MMMTIRGRNILTAQKSLLNENAGRRHTEAKAREKSKGKGKAKHEANDDLAGAEGSLSPKAIKAEIQSDMATESASEFDAAAEREADQRRAVEMLPNDIHSISCLICRVPYSFHDLAAPPCNHALCMPCLQEQEARYRGGDEDAFACGGKNCDETMGALFNPKARKGSLREGDTGH